MTSGNISFFPIVCMYSTSRDVLMSYHDECQCGCESSKRIQLKQVINQQIAGWVRGTLLPQIYRAVIQLPRGSDVHILCATTCNNIFFDTISDVLKQLLALADDTFSLLPIYNSSKFSGDFDKIK